MPTVLLVEDSKLLRFANERVLVKAGYRVICAEDGEEALRKTMMEHPDLVLLDMMLPKLSGPDVLEALKKDPATSCIPVIVLTGLSQRNEPKLLKAGAVGFLEKHGLIDNPALLTEAVEKILGTQTSQTLPAPGEGPSISTTA